MLRRLFLLWLVLICIIVAFLELFIFSWSVWLIFWLFTGEYPLGLASAYIAERIEDYASSSTKRRMK